MKKRLRTTADVLQELKFIQRSMDRLLESFRLEKEAALEQDKKFLEKLRQRERSHYGPALRRMQNELRQLRYRTGIMEGLPSAIFHRLDELETKLKEARAHVTGAANRLARSMTLYAGEDQCTE